MKNTCKTLLAAVMMAGSLTALAGGGNILGTITDPETKEPVADALVIFSCSGNEIVVSTDEQGKFYASNLPACNYKVTVSKMSKSFVLAEEVKVLNDETHTLALNMAQTNNLFGEDGIVVTGEYSRNALLNPVDPVITAYEKGDFEKMSAVTKVTDITALFAGVTEVDGEIFVRGSRGGSLTYYIDGVKVMGNPNIPLNGLEFFRTYVGFVPPKYGDSTAGVVAIETRNYFSE